VILMDEHVLHAAFGGCVRRQWRADYLGVPVGGEESKRFARCPNARWFERCAIRLFVQLDIGCMGLRLG